MQGRCDLGVSCNRGNLPLHYAVESGNVKIVGLLLDQIFNPKTTKDDSGDSSNSQQLSPIALLNFQNSAGLTPFYQALQNGSLDIAAILMSRGGDVNMKDENGWVSDILCIYIYCWLALESMHVCIFSSLVLCWDVRDWTLSASL